MTTALPSPWYVYLVRADNRALYCGISLDAQKRFAQHCAGKGARFFATSPARALVYVEVCADKSTALRRELAIKRLSKQAKEQLLQAQSNQLLVSGVCRKDASLA
ncbi:GIY-YIG nuclease family protein [Pseudomonas sp. C27(2019)]|uniref:GIY-YIG nuclease family protein n=1 Tax=Pseudomonas sp. C27(2019) TaxID=2604941 RepID=UPI00124939B9|nr:GIY-YIG nuclease family protein [Pseudomonas sp. C27(2019)]QEY59258.1 GIY-YIG nuclease family protein [Pseudomonas sp. C27(2019)]